MVSSPPWLRLLGWGGRKEISIWEGHSLPCSHSSKDLTSACQEHAIAWGTQRFIMSSRSCRDNCAVRRQHILQGLSQPSLMITMWLRETLLPNVWKNNAHHDNEGSWAPHNSQLLNSKVIVGLYIKEYFYLQTSFVLDKFYCLIRKASSHFFIQLELNKAYWSMVCLKKTDVLCFVEQRWRAILKPIVTNNVSCHLKLVINFTWEIDYFLHFNLNASKTLLFVVWCVEPLHHSSNSGNKCEMIGQPCFQNLRVRNRLIVEFLMNSNLFARNIEVDVSSAMAVVVAPAFLAVAPATCIVFSKFVSQLTLCRNHDS